MDYKEFLKDYVSFDDFLIKSDKDYLKWLLDKKEFASVVDSIGISLEILNKEVEVSDINLPEEYILVLLNIFDYNLTLFLFGINVSSSFSMSSPPFINILKISKKIKEKERTIKDILDLYKDKKIFFKDNNKIIYSEKSNVFVASLFYKKESLPKVLRTNNKTQKIFVDNLCDGRVRGFNEKDGYMVFSLNLSYQETKFQIDHVKYLLDKLEKELDNIVKGEVYLKGIDNHEDLLAFIESVKI